MKKLSFSDIIFSVFIIALLIPSSRNYIQINVQKVLAQIIYPTIIEPEVQKKLSSYQITFKGINTQNLNLKDAEGKVIFINFWATWCPPCVAEMPSLQKLNNKYQNKIVFAFITNENKKTITQFLNKNDISLPVYQPHSKLPQELHYNSLPTTFIINKKGKIVLHKKGVAHWNSDGFYKKLDALINE